MATRENYKAGVPAENDQLLRIIHIGIDDIIVKLKIAVDNKALDTNLGEGTIAKTNDAVLAILKVFDKFKEGNNFDGTPMVSENGVVLKPDQLNFNNKLGINVGMSMQDIDGEADILDYNTGLTSVDYNAIGVKELNLTKVVDQDQLQKRLENCTALEHYYIAKHKEIIRIFNFVINLFDKYKYAIKVILFLLKNLVRANNSTTPPGSSNTSHPAADVKINLPRPIITGIKLLLNDQKNIQTIITGMNAVVNNADQSIRTDDEDGIDRSVKNRGSPPNVSGSPVTVTVPG